MDRLRRQRLAEQELEALSKRRDEIEKEIKSHEDDIGYHQGEIKDLEQELEEVERDINIYNDVISY